MLDFAVGKEDSTNRLPVVDNGKLNLLGENIFPERLVSKVKSRASIALSNIGEKAVPMLINALADVQKNPPASNGD